MKLLAPPAVKRDSEPPFTTLYKEVREALKCSSNKFRYTILKK